MDSVPLSHPTPSHSNPPTPLRQRALLNSIFHASRSESHTNDRAEGPYSMIDDGSAGRRHGRRAGPGLLGHHAGRLGNRIAALSSRSRSHACSDRVDWHYSPNGSYVPVSSHSRTTERPWGDERPSASETQPGRSGRSGRNGRTRSRRQRQRCEDSRRSCTSVISQQSLRKKLYTLITAGIFFIVVLTIYIAFTASHAHLGRELNILLIFMLLILAIVFCHSFVRFVLAIARGPIVINRSRIPSQLGPGGYAEPDRPIPVVLPADEESMAESEGNTQEKVAPPPPAYGLWRSSVRINPNLIYWHRVEDAAASRQSRSASRSASPKPLEPRPPSYASDNGVDYVIEAQPRHVVPDRDHISGHP